MASGIVLAATAGMMACHPGPPEGGIVVDTEPAGFLTMSPATTSEMTAAAMASATSAAIRYSSGGPALCPFTSPLSRGRPPLASPVRANYYPARMNRGRLKITQRGRRQRHRARPTVPP